MRPFYIGLISQVIFVKKYVPRSTCDSQRLNTHDAVRMPSSPQKSGGHLAYKHTFDKVRDRFWWPTLHDDVKTWCHDCHACQRRKSPHRRTMLPTGHLPVDRLFQRVSIDLVEYKTESVSSTGLKCSYVLTIIDHFTRFAMLVALPNKKEHTIANALVEMVFGSFGPPETLHFDHGPEFENKVVKQRARWYDG